MPWLRQLLVLSLFGIAFGYLEAAVVVYLRAVYEPLHAKLYPAREPGDLVPLVPMSRLAADGFGHLAWPQMELAREAMTMIVLIVVALAMASNFRQWLAAFAFVFGLWDLCYYVFLKVLLDWPASLWTWDILFLVPVPWVAPVLAPGLVALALVLCGAVALRREDTERPIAPAWYHWMGLVVGGALVITAFCWDFRNTSASGVPNPFAWPLFATGMGLGLACFLNAAWRRPQNNVIRPDYLTALATSLRAQAEVAQPMTRR